MTTISRSNLDIQGFRKAGKAAREEATGHPHPHTAAVLRTFRKYAAEQIRSIRRSLREAK